MMRIVNYLAVARKPRAIIISHPLMLRLNTFVVEHIRMKREHKKKVVFKKCEMTEPMST